MATTTTAIDALADPMREERRVTTGSVVRSVLRFCRRKPLGAVGGAIVLVVLICAVFVNAAIIGSDAPLLAPNRYDEQHILDRNQDASGSYWLGTDDFGRDIFSRILYGARTAAIVGFSAVVISAIIALTLGTASAYFAGWTDTIIQRIIDITLAIPALILLVFALTVFGETKILWFEGNNLKLFWITAIVGVVLAAGSVRVIRGAALSVAAGQYVDAAKTIGATDLRIILRHIVPNVLPVIIVLGTVQVGTAILVSAAVSFLGLGVQDPYPDWGVMLSIKGSQQFRVEPIQAVWPGLAIAITVYGFNMLGDALRDVLDPRLRGGR